MGRWFCSIEGVPQKACLKKEKVWNSDLHWMGKCLSELKRLRLELLSSITNGSVTVSRN